MFTGSLAFFVNVDAIAQWKNEKDVVVGGADVQKGPRERIAKHKNQRRSGGLAIKARNSCPISPPLP